MALRLGISTFLLTGVVLASSAVAADDLHMCIYENGDVAIEACNRAIDSGQYHDVDLANAYMNRSAEFLRKKEFDRTIADANASIKLFPKGTLAYNNRGRAYQLKGELKNALADFNVAISHDHENPGAYINRASVYDQQGNRKAAITDLKRALACKPSKDKFVDVEGDFTRAREYLAKLSESK